MVVAAIARQRQQARRSHGRHAARRRHARETVDVHFFIAVAQRHPRRDIQEPVLVAEIAAEADLGAVEIVAGAEVVAHRDAVAGEQGRAESDLRVLAHVQGVLQLHPAEAGQQVDAVMLALGQPPDGVGFDPLEEGAVVDREGAADQAGVGDQLRVFAARQRVEEGPGQDRRRYRAAADEGAALRAAAEEPVRGLQADAFVVVQPAAQREAAAVARRVLRLGSAAEKQARARLAQCAGPFIQRRAKGHQRHEARFLDPPQEVFRPRPHPVMRRRLDLLGFLRGFRALLRLGGFLGLLLGLFLGLLLGLLLGRLDLGRRRLAFLAQLGVRPGVPRTALPGWQGRPCGASCNSSARTTENLCRQVGF